jgi:hypothetical protein
MLHDGAPHVGDEITLSRDDTVVVRHVTVADHRDVAGRSQRRGAPRTA